MKERRTRDEPDEGTHTNTVNIPLVTCMLLQANSNYGYGNYGNYGVND